MLVDLEKHEFTTGGFNILVEWMNEISTDVFQNCEEKIL